MVLDVILVLLIIIFGFIGYRKGFMRSAVGLVSTTVAVIVAIAVSKPVASLFNKIFKLSKLLGKLFLNTVESLGKTPYLTGEAVPATESDIQSIIGDGVFGTIMEKIVRGIIRKAGQSITGFNSPAEYVTTQLGFIALMIIVSILVFVGIKLLLRIFNKKIEQWKQNYVVNKVDRIFGIAFGITRCLVNILIIFMIIFAICALPLLDNVANWLFESSTVGKWFYNLSSRIVLAILRMFRLIE